MPTAWECVAGLLWERNKIVRDSRWNVALFNFYGASGTTGATEICFQTVEGCLLRIY